MRYEEKLEIDFMDGIIKDNYKYRKGEILIYAND